MNDVCLLLALGTATWYVAAQVNLGNSSTLAGNSLQDGSHCSENQAEVRLRPITYADLEELSALVRQEGANAVLVIPRPETADCAKEWVEEALAASATLCAITYAICAPFLAGTCRLRLETSGGTEAQLSYWIAPEYRRRGIGTAAVRAALTIAEGQGVGEVRAYVSVENVASVRLLQHAGFQREEMLVHEQAGPVLSFHWKCDPREEAAC